MNYVLYEKKIMNHVMTNVYNVNAIYLFLRHNETRNENDTVVAKG